jgi:hypothetical protein
MSCGNVDCVGHLRGGIDHKKISPVSRVTRNIWIINSVGTVDRVFAVGALWKSSRGVLGDLQLTAGRTA